MPEINTPKNVLVVAFRMSVSLDSRRQTLVCVTCICSYATYLVLLEQTIIPIFLTAHWRCITVICDRDALY